MSCYLTAYPLGKKMFFAPQPQPEPDNGLVEPGTWYQVIQVIQLVILFASRAFAFVLAPPEESETCQRVILQVTWFILYVIRIVFWFRSFPSFLHIVLGSVRVCRSQRNGCLCNHQPSFLEQ